jgi:hypothetical protein
MTAKKITNHSPISSTGHRRSCQGIQYYSPFLNFFFTYLFSIKLLYYSNILALFLRVVCKVFLLLFLNLLFKFFLIKFNFCVADAVMLLTCLFHFKSVWIVTPRYFVDDSFIQYMLVKCIVRFYWVLFSCYLKDWGFVWMERHEPVLTFYYWCKVLCFFLLLFFLDIFKIYT